jgi:hypothetical protein
MKCILCPVFIGLRLLFPQCFFAAADGENSEALGEVSQRENSRFQEQDTGRQNFKIKMDVNLVTTDVTILGRDIPDLHPEDFMVLDKGMLYSTSIPLITDNQMLKIVVYDNQSDKVGSKLVKLD